MSKPYTSGFIRIALLLSIALFALCMEAMGQDYTRTLCEKTAGQRSLVLQGIFQSADSVYVQVYHDGLELNSSMEVGTFTMTLGTYDYYVLKFTDIDHRTKRIYIMELSDDMIEFYPPVEIDFDRTGNIVLLKQSTGKPDWQEFDVGMSRKAR